MNDRSEIMDRFMNGEFAVHTGESNYSAFIQVCEEHDLVWSISEAGSVNARANSHVPSGLDENSCVDFGVHDGASDGTLFHDKLSFYRNNEYKVVEFDDFMSEHAQVQCDIDDADIMAMIGL